MMSHPDIYFREQSTDLSGRVRIANCRQLCGTDYLFYVEKALSAQWQPSRHKQLPEQWLQLE